MTLQPPALHVEIKGTGPDLVLLHGWALHGGMWGPWLEQLAAHARLHVIDLPGHGRSPPLVGTVDLAGLALAVSTLVPAGAGIVGWSLGGMVALELARQRPADIAALVLIATTPSFVARPEQRAVVAVGVRNGIKSHLEVGYLYVVIFSDFRGFNVNTDVLTSVNALYGAVGVGF